MTLLASYFEAAVTKRSDGLRVDVNIYGTNSCYNIVNLFESFPLLSCKRDEFNVWAKIVHDLKKFQNRGSSMLSLDRYMKHFIGLDLELDRIRNRNGQ